ncbi:hypothetical protein FIBSPDRAFT_496310 [Athelia psychrophila]|uniref:Uncharacterized protein n=1 Tax=Athelia psychrophila TaxID=1759441 RepID=A0A166KKQ5_9AGAM|nr:hypothetical protein FIBSPDRAFT_496310 [Fibularhizoctonia sp. CBS 109695]
MDRFRNLSCGVESDGNSRNSGKICVAMAKLVALQRQTETEWRSRRTICASKSTATQRRKRGIALSWCCQGRRHPERKGVNTNVGSGMYGLMDHRPHGQMQDGGIHFVVVFAAHLFAGQFSLTCSTYLVC